MNSSSPPALDNLCSTFCAMEGIMQASHGAHSVSMVAMFDNEEVGSLSPPGADSTFVEAVIKRIMSSLDASPERTNFDTSRTRSGIAPSGESNYLAIDCTQFVDKRRHGTRRPSQLL